jgi:LysR family glycine cleavage system transcriptional activator
MANGLPPLRALHAFEVVGRCRSIKQAAAELGVSPSAVSQQISILENVLKYALLDRRRSGVALTANGKRYHAAAAQFFEEMRLAHREAVLVMQAPELLVSALPLFASRWLAPRMFEWQNSHSDINVRLEGTTVEPKSTRSDCDFRISYLDRVNVYDNYIELFTDSLIPVCSPRLMQDMSNAMDPEQLRKYRLLTIDWSSLCTPPPTWAEWFRIAGCDDVEIHDTFIFSLSSLAIEAAISGNGIALAQRAMVVDDISAGRLIVPCEIELKLSSAYYLAWDNTVFDKPGTRNFHRWILGAARRPLGRSLEMAAV